jgi:hypothetical protein
MDNQEKKVYVAPQMTVVEYDCQGALLNCSGDCPIPVYTDPNDD